MIYTKQTIKAMKFAYKAHDGQTDKGGVPYIFHPIHIAEQMKDEETTVCALLHDILEDTQYTEEDLKNEGFSDSVIQAVKLLTRDKNIPYMEYIRSLKENDTARAVKLADLKHNSDISRIPDVDDNALRRIEKYKKAEAILEKMRYE